MGARDHETTELGLVLLVCDVAVTSMLFST
jgi:hypothetical protein